MKHKFRSVVTAVAVALGVTVLGSTGVAHAGLPGDGCGYNVHVGHRTNIALWLWNGPGPSYYNVGYVDQWYSGQSASCKHTAANFHSTTWFNNYPARGSFSLGLEVMDNTPQGSAIRGEGGQWSPLVSTGIGNYSYGVDIHQDYDSFSAHAVITNSNGTVVCSAYTDTHDYNTGGNTAGSDATTYCGGGPQG